MSTQRVSLRIIHAASPDFTRCVRSVSTVAGIGGKLDPVPLKPLVFVLDDKAGSIGRDALAFGILSRSLLLLLLFSFFQSRIVQLVLLCLPFLLPFSLLARLLFSANVGRRFSLFLQRSLERR